jgi:hypothetical protein
MGDQLAIPPSDLRKRDFQEMIRAWIADEGLHCTLNIGTRGEDEKVFWGILLADVVRHLADALYQDKALDKQETIAEIRKQLLAELDKPSDETFGYFNVQ